MLVQCFQVKINFEKKKTKQKNGSSNWEISFCCTRQKYNDAIPYYPFFAPFHFKETFAPKKPFFVVFQLPAQARGCSLPETRLLH